MTARALGATLARSRARSLPTAPSIDPPTVPFNSPRKVKRRGIVWLGAALLGAVLQIDL